MANEVLEKGRLAKRASYKMPSLRTEDKNVALERIAKQLLEDEGEILQANQVDLEAGRKNGLSEAVLDRIMLNSDRIKAMVEGIRQVIELQDPIGDVLETITKENGLYIEKRRVPIGVIGMIYEARPNVTIDAATLALKTGNAIILRGSSSAKSSNIALVKSIHTALENSRVPVNAVQLIEDTSRETAKALFQLNEYLDVLIPRGGKNLIQTVVREASVPVIETGAGNCHIYIDESAKPSMVEEVVLNAKLQRPSVCNAVESLLIHENWFHNFGRQLLDKLAQHQVFIFRSKCKTCKQYGRSNRTY